jgi:hypothetical protein
MLFSLLRLLRLERRLQGLQVRRLDQNGGQIASAAGARAGVTDPVTSSICEKRDSRGDQGLFRRAS